MEKIISKKVLCTDENYRFKTLILKSYNIGSPGYIGELGVKKQCKYCKELHNIIICPYKWYYHE